MSDTPETDAASFLVSQGDPNEWAVPLEIALKLERERNSLQEQRDFAISEIERLKQERDEARDVNAKLRNIVETAINYLDQSYRDGFADEVSDLRYELEQLKEAAK